MKLMMEHKHNDRSVRERVGMTVLAADPANLVATLVEIEDAGVDHIWTPFGPAWNPDLLTTLAAAAMRTTHLKLGTSIVQVSSRHPVLLAQQALSLNALAPDRLRLGIGTGTPMFAKRMYGVEMEPPLSYLREYVQVLRPLLQQGEVHHQDRFFTTDASLHASTQVPVYIAALGPAAFRLAGEVADGALPFMCPIPYLLNIALPALNEGAVAAGRPRPTLVAHVPVALTEDRATALQAGRQAMTFQTTIPVYRKMFLAAGFSQQEIDTVSDSFVESLLIFGDESKIKDRLLELLATGIDELTIGLVAVSDAIQERGRLAKLLGTL
jgi:F420-dependent oxidoreductase-like protein